ncbi:MAG TPA: signal peptidase I [Actinomycetes bacterium]
MNPGERVQPTRMQRYHGRHSRRRQSRLSAELPLLVLTAFVLAVLVKGFLVQAFFIPSRSMEPTLDVGDRVVVNRLAYRLGEPKHGQVVVFVRETADKRVADQGPMSWVRRAVAQSLGGTPPGSEDLIKRVVGLPGDVVEGRDGRLWRNGRPVVEAYLPPNTFTSDFGPVRVKPEHYWMMGDNREDSADSRFFGQVPRAALVGRAFIKVWPVPHVGGL